ncbi:lactadherin-like [Petromyzon marinus]|uniref:lactadherin-like n=1 Tax=Petromyzon marinus TaxID=7757 RepID=UPI003F6F611D
MKMTISSSSSILVIWLAAALCGSLGEKCHDGFCANGGTCFLESGKDGTNLKCHCTPEFIGRQCEERLPGPCSRSPCHNGGKCEVQAMGRGDSLEEPFRCSCAPGFKGDLCQEGPCSSSPCHNGGQCEASLGVRGDSIDEEFHCKCPRGFKGQLCTDNIDECLDKPCQNGGICRDLKGDYTCDCPADYTGKNCQLRCGAPLGMEGGGIKSYQISASSMYSGIFGLQKWFPFYARLNRNGLVNAWTPDDQDRSAWIQVDLGRAMRVSGVTTQGARRMGSAEYIKKFTLAFSDDGKMWSGYREARSTKNRIFPGNWDNSTPRVTALSPSITSRYVRLLPTICHNRCTLRMELLGCELTGCSEPLGVKDGRIKDKQMTASGVFHTLGLDFWGWEPHFARLDATGRVNAWTPASCNEQQWLQVDLLRPRRVSGVVTQGARDLGTVQFVRAYKVAHSDDGKSWTLYKDGASGRPKIFAGNYDNNTHKKNMFESPFWARYVRILPTAWFNRITLRVEILGCDE